LETGTIRVKTKDDLEKFIKKKLAGYQVIEIDYEKGSSGRAWVKAKGGDIPEDKVGLYLFQFFVEQ